MKNEIGSRKIWKLILLAGVVLLLGYGLGKYDLSGRKPVTVECLGKGELSAPLFSLPDMNGEKVELASFRGRVIVLEFWATWCAPCREEIPVLNQIYRGYKEKGLVVIGISLDHRPSQEVKKFLEETRVEYLNVLGGEEILEKYSQVANLGAIRGIPATFIIDRQGQICQRYMGLTEKKVLEEAIKAVL